MASGGRGPTRLMSPRSTLTSCGNSSIEKRRRCLPTGVTRGSSLILNRTPSDSLRCDSCARRRSASVYMVRNFQMVNGRPSLPMRSCLNSAGPGEVQRIRNAAPSSSGESASSSAAAPILSTVSLAQRRTPVRLAWSRCSIGRPSTGRTVVRSPATSTSAEATIRSTSDRSRLHASRRSARPSISGQDRTMTVSARSAATASAMRSKVPRTRVLNSSSAPSARSVGRQAATTSRPW